MMSPISSVRMVVILKVSGSTVRYQDGLGHKEEGTYLGMMMVN